MTYQIRNTIIYSENNRAIKKNLIGKLTSKEFNEWCINWWLKNGLDENSIKCNDGKLRDPYTGQLIGLGDKKSKLVLEHIIPIDSGGGTIIFNVVPSRADTNSSKLAYDPLSWWQSEKGKKFFSKERLKVFINYLFDAYDKRIKDGVFSSDFDDIIDDDLSYDDFLDELDTNDSFEKQNKKAKAMSQLQKIKYSDFLATCITLLSEYDKELANSYIKKLESYESYGVFSNINLYQKIQSILFNKIKRIDDSRRYEFINRINMDLLIKSLNNIDNFESEITNRFNKILELIQRENTIVSFNNILFTYPNIICIPPNVLEAKIDEIRKLNLSKDILLFLRNNFFLLFLPIDEIPNMIKKIKLHLGEEYFNVFINTSLQYSDIKVLNYIKNCTESKQLKNLPKQDLNDKLDIWLKNNTQLPFNVTFVNTVSSVISGRSRKYTNFNGNINQLYIGSIVTALFEFVNNNQKLLNEPDKLKNLLHKLIWNISNENLEKMKLVGNDINEQRISLFNLFSAHIDDSFIQNYFYLELIKNKKLLSLEKNCLLFFTSSSINK